MVKGSNYPDYWSIVDKHQSAIDQNGENRDLVEAGSRFHVSGKTDRSQKPTVLGLLYGFTNFLLIGSVQQ